MTTSYSSSHHAMIRNEPQSRRGPRSSWTALCLALSVALTAPAAHAQSMEERLRSELRNVTQQLQQLQSERAQTMAAKSTAEAQREAARKDNEQLRAQMAQLRTQLGIAQDEAGKLEAVREAAHAQVAASYAQIDKFRGAYEELLGIARASEAKRVTLEASLKDRDGLLTMCEQKNAEMYVAGKELLSAYEAFGTGDMLKIRQPFAGQARVLFDEQAQAHGDKLYEAQFNRDAAAALARKQEAANPEAANQEAVNQGTVNPETAKPAAAGNASRPAND